MQRVSPDDLIRHFHENGLKLLLQDAANVRDLLTLRDPVRAARMDFSRMTVEPTTYIAADYRHLCADLVLKVPYRTRLGGRRRTLTLYILIEHQSEPEVLMVLRVVEYLVQIYKGQLLKKKETAGRIPADFRLRPVLPIVLYTGRRRWEALTPLAELVLAGGQDFADVVPRLRPLFLNLSAVPPADLEASGGFFGWVLELIRQRFAPPDEFRATTGRVVDHLEAMAEVERERWLLFLSYIGKMIGSWGEVGGEPRLFWAFEHYHHRLRPMSQMIHHDRAEPEHPPLEGTLLCSIRSDARRREVQAMLRTMADVLRAEGREEGRRAEKVHGRRETLVRLLRRRFGRVPRAVKEVIRATDDIARLDAWFDKAATAQTLADVGIPAQPDQ